MTEQALRLALEALQATMNEIGRNTCMHEETYRGGVIWEICRACGSKWADDEGGKPEYKEPAAVTLGYAAIAAVKEALASVAPTKAQDGEGGAAVQPMPADLAQRIAIALDCGILWTKDTEAQPRMQKVLEEFIEWRNAGVDSPEGKSNANS